MYRVRTLYRAYGTDHRSETVIRPRGRSPYQLSFFWRTATLTYQAAALAGILQMMDVIPSNPEHKAPPFLHSLQAGEDVCTAYELFHAYIPTSEISIEHTFLLASALARGDEVRISHCTACDGLILVDSFEPLRQICAFCSPRRKCASDIRESP
jgi:hypothetical protein